MSNPTIALSGLSTRTDFSQLQGLHNKTELEALLKGEGKITFDDNNKLTTIEVPEKRDSAIKRFFKGLFSSTYRADQRKMDRAEALEQNRDFSIALHTSVSKSLRPSESHAFRWGRLFCAQHEPGTSFTATNLRSALTQTNAMNARLENMSQETFASNNGSAASVLTAQGTLSAHEFLGVPKNTATFPDMCNAVLSAVVRNARGVENSPELLSTQDQQALRTLYLKPNPTSEDHAQLDKLTRQLTCNLNDQLVNLINTGLQEGKSEAAVRQAVAQTMQTISRGNDDIASALNEGRDKISNLPEQGLQATPQFPTTEL